MVDAPASETTPRSGDGIAWRPSDEYVRRSRLKRFMDRHGIATLDELNRRSTDDLDWFWRAVSDDLELEWYRPFEQVVDTQRGIAWPRWWVGGQFNYVHNALDKHVTTERRNKLALIWEGEDGAEADVHLLGAVGRDEPPRQRAARRSASARATASASSCRWCPEVCIASLACSKVGAIFTPIFSGYAAPRRSPRASTTARRSC